MVVIVVETMSTLNTVRNANVWILIVRISIPTVPIGLNRATVPKPMFLSWRKIARNLAKLAKMAKMNGLENWSDHNYWFKGLYINFVWIFVCLSINKLLHTKMPIWAAWDTKYFSHLNNFQKCLMGQVLAKKVGVWPKWVGPAHSTLGQLQLIC